MGNELSSEQVMLGTKMASENEVPPSRLCSGSKSKVVLWWSKNSQYKVGGDWKKVSFRGLSRDTSRARKASIVGIEKKENIPGSISGHIKSKKSQYCGGGGKPFFFLTIIKTYFKVNNRACLVYMCVPTLYVIWHYIVWVGYSGEL